MLRLIQTKVLMLSHLHCVHPSSQSYSSFSLFCLMKFFFLQKAKLPSAVFWYINTPCTKMSTQCQLLLTIQIMSNSCAQLIYTWGSLQLKASTRSRYLWSLQKTLAFCTNISVETTWVVFITLMPRFCSISAGRYVKMSSETALWCVYKFFHPLYISRLFNMLY